jgi:hypothetical protein
MAVSDGSQLATRHQATIDPNAIDAKDYEIAAEFNIKFLVVLRRTNTFRAWGTKSFIGLCSTAR